ncbi:hypothetical protein EJO66_08440 [Variovorax beijingensis]|uniref:Mutator family transposase n=1 Tax=Variovorax beijingensis TaxID=2496117 RepID=A0ABY0A9G1_9BURK|nr:hypothetical protein EJO66_08440 [Variovorax beijingensis]
MQDSADAARAQWRSVADQLRDKFPKLGSLTDDAENDVLAFMTFPRAHWTQIYTTEWNATFSTPSILNFQNHRREPEAETSR